MEESNENVQDSQGIFRSSPFRMKDATIFLLISTQCLLAAIFILLLFHLFHTLTQPQTLPRLPRQFCS